MKQYLKVIILFLTLSSQAQDLEEIGKSKPITVSGGISADATLYDVNGIENRRDPFFWMLNANLNFDIYGIAVPFSATFTQQDRSFTQPFNQYGLSPTYKAITLHVGYRNMPFSNYTQSGNTFLGAGIEIIPQNSLFKVSALYGRFSRAVAEADTIGNIIGIPAYERWGYGSKVTIGSPQHNVDLIFFKAKDIVNSISGDPDSLGIEPPAENLVLGINTKQQLSRNIHFNLEYAFSAYNTDIRSSSAELNNYQYMYLGSLFTPNSSAQFNKAILSDVTYNAKKYNLKLAYRRIDPQYKTLGSPFLNNDLEDISANISWNMFQNKLNIATSGGIQKNNLDKSQLASMIRLIGSVNMSYQFSEQFNVNASYANFNTSTFQVRLNELDSLNYYQVTQSAGLGANYNFGTKQLKQNIFINANYQIADDIQDNKSKFYNFVTGYQYSITPIGLSLNTSFNTVVSSFANTQNLILGPSIGCSKSFLDKKLRTNLSITSVKTLSESKNINNILNLRTSASYTLDEHNSISGNIGYIQRNNLMPNVGSFREVRLSVRYGYTF